jgi:hypothetical protein
MTTPELSIILVSYNTAKLITTALQSVYDQTQQTSFEIIVVDNASQDDSLAVIAAQFPQVRLIDSGANLGFAGGVQIGVNNSHGQYLLLLNPDTKILDGAIDKLMAFAKTHPNNGIWSGITLNNDLSLNSQHAWSKPSISNLLFSAMGLSKTFSSTCLFNNANYGCWKRDSIKEVDIVSGCFFLTTRKLWDELGGLDPQFFMYAEEADFCLKAAKLGYKPIVTPEAKLIHHGGASHARFSGKMIKLMKGKFELTYRHVEGWQQPLHRGLLFLYVWNKYFMHKVLKSKTEAAREWQTVYDQRSDWMRGYR